MQIVTVSTKDLVRSRALQGQYSNPIHVVVTNTTIPQGQNVIWSASGLTPNSQATFGILSIGTGTVPVRSDGTTGTYSSKIGSNVPPGVYQWTVVDGITGLSGESDITVTSPSTQSAQSGPQAPVLVSLKNPIVQQGQGLTWSASGLTSGGTATFGITSIGTGRVAVGSSGTVGPLISGIGMNVLPGTYQWTVTDDTTGVSGNANLTVVAPTETTPPPPSTASTTTQVGTTPVGSHITGAINPAITSTQLVLLAAGGIGVIAVIAILAVILAR